MRISERTGTIVFFLLCFCSSLAVAQDSVTIIRDTIFIEQQDTVLTQSYARRYDPRKALLYAAIVPGLGQVYNKKYWKLPLVYGGFYALARGIGYYNDIYRTYRAHLFYNLDNNLAAPTAQNPTVGFSTNQLRRIVDRNRRDRDFMVIMMASMYLLQMVDAHVDSHLKEFDLNPNLNVGIEPVFERNTLLGRNSGLAIVIKF